MVGPLCITHLVCDGPSKDAHHKRKKEKTLKVPPSSPPNYLL